MIDRTPKGATTERHRERDRETERERGIGCWQAVACIKHNDKFSSKKYFTLRDIIQNPREISSDLISDLRERRRKKNRTQDATNIFRKLLKIMQRHNAHTRAHFGLISETWPTPTTCHDPNPESGFHFRS